MEEKKKNTILIKKLAFSHGFEDVGIAKVERLTEEEQRLRKWLDNGYHASMSYMEQHFDKRLDPALLVPDAKSVISLLYNYHTEKSQVPDTYKVSKYAYGRDYHKVLKKKLFKILDEIMLNTDCVNARVFVDSAPVMEKTWAMKSGLGWIGKNTLLINPKKGSYYFLAEIILDIELEYDAPISGHCGTCTRCIEACPTGAIASEGYSLDASKCISFLTIENKEAIPDEFDGKMSDFIFGCDICQQVCPWNRFAHTHNEPDFEPKEEFLALDKKDWQNLSEEQYKELFYGNPIARAKYQGLKRNIQFISKR